MSFPKFHGLEYFLFSRKAIRECTTYLDHLVGNSLELTKQGLMEEYFESIIHKYFGIIKKSVEANKY